jgi:hypothetical protein
VVILCIELVCHTASHSCNALLQTTHISMSGLGHQPMYESMQGTCTLHNPAVVTSWWRVEWG